MILGGISGDLQQGTHVEGSKGCTSTGAEPNPQPARSCSPHPLGGSPRRETERPPVKYFDESSTEFAEFVLCCLETLSGHIQGEADPGMDTADSWLKVHGSCLQIPVFRKGWLNSTDWQWMHLKAMQDAKDGSRPFQEIFACLRDARAEQGTKVCHIPWWPQRQFKIIVMIIVSVA